MYPVINLFGKEIGSYGLMAVIGILLVGFLLCLSLRHRGMDDNDGILFLLFVAGGVLVGGHLLYALTNLRHFPLLFEVDGIMQFFSVLGVIFGGSVFYGGLIGGAVAGFAYLRVTKKNVAVYCDLMAPLIPLFHSFARVGCFLGGCCYGIECEFGFVAHGNHLVEAVNDVSRFPVQLLEAHCNLLLAALIWYIGHHPTLGVRFRGRLLYIYMTVYPVIRFLDEFLRGDAIRGFVGPFSTSQFISILLEAVAIFLWIHSARKQKRLRRETENNQ